MVLPETEALLKEKKSKSVVLFGIEVCGFVTTNRGRNYVNRWWMIDWLVWLIDWLLVRWFGRLIDWLIDWNCMVFLLSRLMFVSCILLWISVSGTTKYGAPFESVLDGLVCLVVLVDVNCFPRFMSLPMAARPGLIPIENWPLRYLRGSRQQFYLERFAL